MKQKEVFKKIGGIIQELNEQYEYLLTTADDLNDLELELFVSNAHFLTDHIEILCKLNLQKVPVRRSTTTFKREPESEKKFFEPLVQSVKPTPEAKDEVIEKPAPVPEEVKLEITNPIEPEEQPIPEINLSSAAAEDSYSIIRESEPETIRHELVLDESIAEDEDEFPIAETKIEEPIIEPEPIVEPKVEEQIIETKIKEPAIEHNIINEPLFEEITPLIHNHTEFKHAAVHEEDEVLTVNQRMSSQIVGKAEQMSLKPISDIKLAITLNDKLLYVKDLFNGYNLAYSEAVEILNRFNTFEEAQRFLNTNYVTKNNWDSKPATTEKFYTLLKRRYA